MSTLPANVEFLVIDDDPRVGRFVVALLESKKHSSVSFSGAAEAVGWLENNRCEVAIVDVDMPQCDGISLIPFIRDFCPTVPIIMFTGWGYDEEKMQASLCAGANGFVSKSLRVEQLYSVLQHALGRARDKTHRDSSQTAGVGAI